VGGGVWRSDPRTGGGWRWEGGGVLWVCVFFLFFCPTLSYPVYFIIFCLLFLPFFFLSSPSFFPLPCSYLLFVLFFILTRTP
jgi:hypothetical protein